MPQMPPATTEACKDGDADVDQIVQLEADEVQYQVEAIQTSYHDLQSKFAALEDSLIVLQREKEYLKQQNLSLSKTLDEVRNERDTLCSSLREAKCREDELVRQREEEFREKLELQIEAQAAKSQMMELNEEMNKRFHSLFECFGLLESVKECLMRTADKGDEERPEALVREAETETEVELELDEELKRYLLQIRHIHKLAEMVESQILWHEERGCKEKKQLENSIVSLTEENRDISSLLRIAIAEKEAAEKTIVRLKGGGEQKRVALLQFAEKGLQKVGFGFMMGASTGDVLENAGDRLDSTNSSDCEEEVISLATTVEKIMKRLRLETIQLRQSLEESRSDCERLQCLTEKQAQQIADTTLYIKDLEERESILTQNIEELISDLTEAEEDAARWREACELEVEAGKSVMEERDRENTILKEELQRAKAFIDLLTNKLKLKEELATAAMAAQVAAEKSLQLADSRSAGLRDRIEELTKQVEEAEKRGERRNRQKVRRVCWPWPAVRINPASRQRQNASRRLLPEMQALLHAD